MPLTGSTPKQCFETFRAHLAHLLRQTVATRIPVLVEQTTDHAHVGFLQRGIPKAVALETREHGRLYFWAAQYVQAEKRPGGDFKLSTLKYWYKLLASDQPKAPPLIRWEYDRALRKGHKHCRHHMHLSATMGLTGMQATLDLDKLHVPTGWVALEEVLRFLIHDLGVRPPCGRRWPSIIEESERVFREDFSTRH